eukprot:COSAG04_NODE_591_length_12289_cov_10.947252_3_plen_1124_part_00
MSAAPGRETASGGGGAYAPAGTDGSFVRDEESGADPGMNSWAPEQPDKQPAIVAHAEKLGMAPALGASSLPDGSPNAQERIEAARETIARNQAARAERFAAVGRRSVEEAEHQQNTTSAKHDISAASAVETAALLPTDGGAGGSAEGGDEDEDEEKPPSCCTRCLFALQNYKVRGIALPKLFVLGGSLVLPELDAASDWLVTIKFYMDGDMNWFHASLTILLVSGVIATIGLVMTFGIVGTDCCTSLGDKDCGLPSCCGGFFSCGNLALLLLAAPFAMPGLAPVATAALTLYMGKDGSSNLLDGLTVKAFKAAELLFEALPQSTLQGYVAISYGKLNPSDPEKFSKLLAFSICISVLGAGATFFSFEAMFRNQFGDRDVVRTASRYGLVTILLRASQTGTLVFWVSLMACAEKGLALYAVVASLIVYFCLMFEAIARKDTIDIGGNCCDDCCFITGVGTFCGLGRKPGPRMLLWNTLPLLIAGAIATTFYTVEHVDNNYANSSAPVGPPGSPQHYDCRDRTSGIYPAVLMVATSFVLMLLSLAMDPEVSTIRCIRGKSAKEKRAEQLEEDEKTVLKRLLEERGQELHADADRLLELLDEASTSWAVLLERKIHDLWGWVDKAQRGSLGKLQLERLSEAVGYDAAAVLALLKVRCADGKPADELVTKEEWDDSKHGEGTEVMMTMSEGDGTKVALKDDGRRGVVIEVLEHAGDTGTDTYINITFDNGGESDWIHTSEVSVADYSALDAVLESGAFDGVELAEADFRAACRENSGLVRAWTWTLLLPGALWGWAAEAQQGSLGKPQLERLTDALGVGPTTVYRMLKVRGADGKPADELVTFDAEWDDRKHGRGTKVMVKSGGRRGVVVDHRFKSMDDVKIWVRFDDDDGPPPSFSTRDVSVEDHSALDAALGSGAFDGVSVTEADFRAACREAPAVELKVWNDDNPLKGERMMLDKTFADAWFEKLRLAPALDVAFEAAVLERQIDAVWRWADAVADGTLAYGELEHLADALHSSDDKRRYAKVFAALKVRAADGKAADELAPVDEEESDQRRRAIRDWSEFNAALESGDFDNAALSKADFYAACRSAPKRDRYDRPGRFVEAWFERLGLSLLPREASCLDILCV